MSKPIDQHEYWNVTAGQTWARLQPKIDAQLAPLGAAAIAALAPAAGERILDIGCGSGATSLEIARCVGSQGRVTGIDISAPMLANARARAKDISNLEFLEADAAAHRFDQPFDAAFSRFGVMFFPNPIPAFTQVKADLKPGGRLCFICWRALTDNPWMMVPLNAALRHLPPLPPPDPDAPGPGFLADPAKTHLILSRAGFAKIEITPADIMIGTGSLEDSVELALYLGPLGMMLREHPDKRDIVTSDVREALAAHLTSEGVQLPSATWIVRAA